MIPDDHQEFDRTLSAILPQMRAIAKQIAPDPDSVYDILQDARIRIWKNWPTRRPESLYRWIYKIVRNVAIDYYRAERIRHITNDLPVLSLEAIDGDAWTATDHDPAHNPEQLLLMRERSGPAHDAANSIPSVFCETLFLLADGMSYIQAAEHFGVPIGTVRSRQFRARLLAREILTNERI